MFVIKDVDDVILDYDDNEDSALERAYVIEMLINKTVRVVEEDYDPIAKKSEELL